MERHSQPTGRHCLRAEVPMYQGRAEESDRVVGNRRCGRLRALRITRDRPLTGPGVDGVWLARAVGDRVSRVHLASERVESAEDCSHSWCGERLPTREWRFISRLAPLPPWAALCQPCLGSSHLATTVVVAIAIATMPPARP